MCILTCTVALVVSYFILQKILFSQKLENSNDIPKSPLIRKNSEVSERILCYVPLVREKLRVAKVIKETWGSNCDELVFYGDTDNSELNIKNINVTEKYELLWGKTKAILVHLHNNYANVRTYIKIAHMYNIIALLFYNYILLKCPHNSAYTQFAITYALIYIL